MDKELLEVVLNGKVKEVTKHMICPQRHFGGGSTSYEFSEKEQDEAIDYENLTIKTDVWMDNVLEIDEYAKNINRMMYLLVENDKDMFDYNFFEYLKDELKMDIDKESEGYTYNDSDCCLDRDIHYTHFTNDENDNYIIFSVHHGADARVGFGWNVCFHIPDYDKFVLGMTIDCWDSVTDEDYSIWELEDIATYNKETETWCHKESGNEISLHSSANGW